MIVRLVLEVHKPLFLNAVYLHRHDDAAGIDLIRLLLVSKFPFPLQLPHGHQRQIHQAYKLVLPPLKDLAVICKILPVSLFHRFPVIPLSKGHLRKFCGKGGMTAVVRPVGIKDTDLRHGRIPVFLLFKIGSDMQEILKSHGKPQGIIQFLEIALLHIPEAVKNLHIFRLVIILHQSLRLLKSGLPGINRIDTVRLNPLEFFLRNDPVPSLNHVCCCRPDDRLLIFINKLHALYGRIRTLVKLSRKIFHGEHPAGICHRKFLLIQRINRRFRKDAPAGLLKSLI